MSMRPLLPLVLGAAVMLACGGGGDAPTTAVPLRAAITAVEIAPAGPVSVPVGTSRRFTVALTQPDGAPAAAVRWSVSDPTLATVSSAGDVTATGNGAFTLLAMATTVARDGFRADTLVSSVAVTTRPPAITAIEVQPGIAFIPVGGSATLRATVVRASPDVTVRFTYRAQSPYVSVDSGGVITTLYPISSVVWVTAVGSGPGYETTTLVGETMLQASTIAGIASLEVVPSTLTMTAGSTASLRALVAQPPGAPPATIVAETGTASVALVQGEGDVWSVVARQPGIATITVRAQSPALFGFTAATKVVTVPIEVR